MGAGAMFDHLDRVNAHRRGAAQPEARPWSSAWMAEHTGATYRQLDYWVRSGILGAGLRGGSGTKRRFTPVEFEIASALAELAALGAQSASLEIAARAVRAGRVSPAGERLVLMLDGTCFRHPTDSPVAAQGPMWVVPLLPCPFSPTGALLSDAAQDPRGAA